MEAEQGTGNSAPCPACGADNTPDAPRCSACGILIGRKRRRGVSAESDTPFSGEVPTINRPALRAYRISIYGMLPGLGLVGGPVAVVLGLRACYRARGDRHFTARGPALAAVLFGVLTAVTNWVGFVLMYLGLRQAGWF
jgi:hypothetical protein